MNNVYALKLEDGTLMGVLQVISCDKFSKIIYYNNELQSVLDEDTLRLKNYKNYASYAEFAMVFDNDKVPYEKFASNLMVEQLIRKMDIIDSLFNGEERLTAVISNQNIILDRIFTYEENNLNRTNLYSDNLNYESMSTQEQEDYSIKKKLSHLNSIKELQSRYDCSYLFDDKGNSLKNYSCVLTEIDLDNLITELKSLKQWYPISYSVNTDGKNFFYLEDNPEERSKVLGVSLSWEDNQGVYIPFQSEVFSCLDIHTVMKKLLPELLRLRIITFTGSFEYKANFASGYEIKIGESVCLLDFNIYPFVQKGAKSMKTFMSNWYGLQQIDYYSVFDGKVDLELKLSLPCELLQLVECIKVEYTRRLFFDEIKYINPSQYRCYRWDVGAIEILQRGEYFGIKINQDKRMEIKKEYLQNQVLLTMFMDRFIEVQGFQVFKDRKILELMDKAATIYIEQLLSKTNTDEESEELMEKYNNDELDIPDEVLLDYVNNNLESDNVLKEQYTPIINKILGNPKRYTSTKLLANIEYNILGYPILVDQKITKAQKRKRAKDKEEARLMGIEYHEPKKKPATGNDAIMVYEQYKLKESLNIMSEDLCNDKGKVILDSKKFNYCKYPFFIVLKEYNIYQKHLETFFADKYDKCSVLYADNEQGQMVTARIKSSSQTINGNNKECVIPYQGYYCNNSDYSQIELREMYGGANEYWHNYVLKVLNPLDIAVMHRDGLQTLIDSMNDPDTDIHRATAASIYGVTAEEVTYEQRHNAKSKSLGKPYDRGDFSLSMENIIKYVDKASGNADKLQEIIINDTAMDSAKWNASMYPLVKYLERDRKAAVKVNKDPNNIIPPYLEGRDFSFVENPYGRRRYWLLDVATEVDKHSIWKEAGNFRTQSGARDRFITNQIRLYTRLKLLGYIKPNRTGKAPEMDPIIFPLFVHDEFLNFTRNDIHPFILIKAIYECCFVKQEFHPRYFMGVSFVHNWKEGKDGKYELPVRLVQYIANLKEKDFPPFEDGNFILDNNIRMPVVEYFDRLRKNWNFNRLKNEIANALNQPLKSILELNSDNIDWDLVASKLTHYVIVTLIGTAYVDIYNVKQSTVKETSKSDILKALWDKRDFNYFNTYEESEEDISDLFEMLGGEIGDEGLNMRERYKQLELQVKEEIQNCFFNPEEMHTEVIVEKERDTYEVQNVIKQNQNINIQVNLLGQLTLNLKMFPKSYQEKILNDILRLYYMKDGDIIRVITKGKVIKLDERIYNPDREVIQDIWEKYYKEYFGHDYDQDAYLNGGLV